MIQYIPNNHVICIRLINYSIHSILMLLVNLSIQDLIFFFNVFVRRNEKEMKNKCYCGEKLKLSIFMAAPTDSLEYQFESIFCLNFTHELD